MKIRPCRGPRAEACLNREGKVGDDAPSRCVLSGCQQDDTCVPALLDALSAAEQEIERFKRQVDNASRDISTQSEQIAIYQGNAKAREVKIDTLTTRTEQAEQENERLREERDAARTVAGCDDCPVEARAEQAEAERDALQSVVVAARGAVDSIGYGTKPMDALAEIDRAILDRTDSAEEHGITTTEGASDE